MVGGGSCGKEPIIRSSTVLINDRVTKPTQERRDVTPELTKLTALLSLSIDKKIY